MVEKARNRGFVFNDNKRGDKRGGKDKQEQQEAKLRYSCSHHTEMRSPKKKGFEHSDFCVSASDEESCCSVIVRPLEEGHSNQNNAKIRTRSRSQTALHTGLHKCAHLACPRQFKDEPLVETCEPMLC